MHLHRSRRRSRSRRARELIEVSQRRLGLNVTPATDDDLERFARLAGNEGLLPGSSDAFEQLRPFDQGGLPRPELRNRPLAKTAAPPPAPLPAPSPFSRTDHVRARSWSHTLDYLEARARARRLEVLFLDVDNTLIRPRGFVGSEHQEWTSLAAMSAYLEPDAARRLVLAQRDRDEARMLETGFFETVGKLDRFLPRLQALRTRNGVKLIALSARPPTLREQTLAMMRAAGLDDRSTLHEVIFCAGRGDAKGRQLLEAMERMGLSDRSRALLVDDHVENTRAAGALGVSTVQLEGEDNYRSWTSSRFLRRAARRTFPAEQFELLINAWAVAASQTERDQAAAGAELLLDADSWRRFEAATRDLASVLPPLVGLSPGRP